MSFGDAAQVFNVGAGVVRGATARPRASPRRSSAGARSPPPTSRRPPPRWPARASPLNAEQAYIFEILAPILLSTPEASAVFAPGGRVLREGEPFRDADLAGHDRALRGRGRRAVLRAGTSARAIVAWLAARGGQVTHADLEAYAAIPRAPVRASYRGRQVLTNPPPAAGGTLLALAMARLDATTTGRRRRRRSSTSWRRSSSQRTPEFLEGLPEPGFADRFLASRLGSTTHISVMDGDGRACSVTCTNGEGAGSSSPAPAST